MENDIGFTALRYSVIFQKLASALRVSTEEGYMLNTVHIDNQGPLKPAVSIMDLINTERISSTAATEVMQNIDSFSIAPGFAERVKILEALTGVKVDLSKDLKLRLWGPPKKVAVIIVEDPSRILNVFMKSLDTDSKTLDLSILRREDKQQIDSILEYEKVLTAAEKVQLAKRPQTLGYRSPSVDQILKESKDADNLQEGLERL